MHYNRCENCLIEKKCNCTSESFYEHLCEACAEIKTLNEERIKKCEQDLGTLDEFYSELINISAFDKPILVWRFYDAPKELQAFSNNGGDEDWIALVPPHLAGENSYIGWIESNQFSSCQEPQRYKLRNDFEIYIGSHA